MMKKTSFRQCAMLLASNLMAGCDAQDEPGEILFFPDADIPVMVTSPGDVAPGTDPDMPSMMLLEDAALEAGTGVDGSVAMPLEDAAPTDAGTPDAMPPPPPTPCELLKQKGAIVPQDELVMDLGVLELGMTSSVGLVPRRSIPGDVLNISNLGEPARYVTSRLISVDTCSADGCQKALNGHPNEVLNFDCGFRDSDAVLFGYGPGNPDPDSEYVELDPDSAVELNRAPSESKMCPDADYPTITLHANALNGGDGADPKQSRTPGDKVCVSGANLHIIGDIPEGVRIETNRGNVEIDGNVFGAVTATWHIIVRGCAAQPDNLESKRGTAVYRARYMSCAPGQVY